MATEEPKLDPESKAYLSEIDVASQRKEPRLLALVFCDFVNITKDDKANAVGIFDRVFVHPEVKKTPRFALLVRTAETMEDKTWVTVFNPQNNPVIRFPLSPETKDVTSSHSLPRQVQAAIFFDFKVEIDGVYWWDISYKGKSLGGAGLTIEFREGASQDGGTDTYK